MSCSYADGLSEYEYKGVLGVPEKFESEDKVNEKCEILADWIKNAKHVVVHTGAGISTSSGIPDFRGPNGVWTLEKQGKKPNINISFNEAIPSKTHMALKHLIDNKVIHYIISQNIDGLHLRTGVSRNNISELHGNMFIGQCNLCESQFVRSEATSTVGKKCLNEDCKRSAMLRGRSCRGKLHDTILDWEDSLPEFDLEMSDYQSSLADLNICLGTTLQIVPSGNLPLRCKKYGGKVVIVNLQPTKHDKKADLIINTYVDEVLGKVMKKLGLEIPEYTSNIDPTKHQLPETVIEWNILKRDLNQTKVKHDKLVKEYKKRKLEENELNNTKKKPKTEKTKVEVVVKLEKLNKKQKRRIIRNDLRINIENKDYNNAKSRVKNENLTKIESKDQISVKKESLNNSENKNLENTEIINSSSRENGDYPELKVENKDPNHLDNGVGIEKQNENISESKEEKGTTDSTLENKDFEERTESENVDSPKMDTENDLKNEGISGSKDEEGMTDSTLENKDFEERTESEKFDSPKMDPEKDLKNEDIMGSTHSTLENNDFEERTESENFDSPKMDTENDLKNEDISGSRDKEGTTHSLENKDFEEAPESGDLDSPKIEDTENNFQPNVTNSQNKDLQKHLENSFPVESNSSVEGGMENGNIVSLENKDDGKLY